mgnify:FL=1
MFEQFLKQWEFSKCMEKTLDFTNFVAYKYGLKVDDVVADFNEFVKEEETKLRAGGVDDDFKTFMDKNEDKLAPCFPNSRSAP